MADRSTQGRGNPPDESQAGGDAHRTASGDGARPARSLEQEGVAGAHEAEQNRLLRALPMEDYEAILPHLTPIRLTLKQVLIEANVPIRDVYFVREGVISFIAEQEEHGSVEVGTIGPDGFIGTAVLLGAETIPYVAFAQIEGHAWRLPADRFRQIVDERKSVRRLLMR